MGPMMFLMLACGATDADLLTDVEVEQAWLEDVALREIIVLGGVLRGSAELVVETTDDEVLRGTVDLRGGEIGLALDLAFAGSRQLQLKLPDAPITGDQLLGRYQGFSDGLAVPIGVEVLHLRNEHHVEIDEPLLLAGIGLSISCSWLELSLQEFSWNTDTGELL